MRRSGPPTEGLRPLLGEQTDLLDYAYLTGTADERAELEVLAELLRRQAASDRRPLLEPPPGDQADGPIRLGRILHGDRELGWLGIEPDDLCQHLLLIGRSGAGKSTLAVRILRSLSELGHAWCAFDYKRSLRALVAMDLPGEVQVVTLGREIGASLKFNPLAPPPGVPADSHHKQLVELLCQSWFAGDGVAALLQRAIRLAAERVSPEIPTFAEVRSEVDAMALREREALWRQSALRILEVLTTGHLGRVLNSRRDAQALHQLLHNRTIIELDGLNTKDGSFLISCIMRYLSSLLLSGQEREKLRLAVFADEAHHLLAKSDSARESVMETVMREGREAGLGVLMATQSFFGLSPVAIANAATLLVMHCTHRGDVQAGSAGLLLKDEQRDLLALLRVGEAVGRKSRGWSRPVLVRIPPMPMPKGAVRDSDLTRLFLVGPFARGALDRDEQARADSADPGHEHSDGARIEDIPVIPHADRRGLETDPTSTESTTDRQPEPPTSSDRGTDHRADPLLTQEPEAARFLTHIAEHPLIGVAERYGRLGLSRRKGDAIKRALQSEGYIRPVGVTTETGKTLLLDLGVRARPWLQDRGIRLPATNASLPHRWWQHRVAELLREHGWTAECEKVIDGHAFDVVATRESRTAIVEIETGRSNWLLNLQSLGSVRADHRAVLWLDTEQRSRAEAVCPEGIMMLRIGTLRGWIDAYIATQPR